MQNLWLFGKKLPALPASTDAQPDWIQANPKLIDRALSAALSKPSGGWLAVDASRRIGETPVAYRIDGRDLVLWRIEGQLFAAPEACPHMGASLAGADVRDGKLVCPWHGLELGPKGHGAWRCIETHDDGVLAWVRFEKDASVPAPILAPRPAQFLDGVIRKEARCEPRDVIANRLDPWHGNHFHPYAFSNLRVSRFDENELALRVAYRVAGRLAMEVDATFHCPEPRTIVMTIVAGDGTGSVVETHATPIDADRTAILEATLATSDRAGFIHALPWRGLIRPFIEWSAGRLWQDDAAYAERLYDLRTKKSRSLPVVETAAPARKTVPPARKTVPPAPATKSSSTKRKSLRPTAKS